jgi:dihydroorotate dehydrogenase (fumarate)
MDLSTTYLGLNLRTPLIASASPLSEHVDTIKHLEDVGASAVVLFSLFEEQIEMEQQAIHHHTTHGAESFAEAVTYTPDLPKFHHGPDAYLNHIRKAKEAVDIPIIASLNAYSIGGWTRFARQIQDAGADALELNVYYIPTDVNLSGAQVEQTYLDVMQSVKSVVSIPVAMKLSPFFSNMAYMAKRLDDAGANGLVLFNRFYQPDIDLEELEVRPNVLLSTPQALRLPMRWLAILYGRIKADMAATSGIHAAEDVLKMLMVGANAVMMASTLLKNGVTYVSKLEQDLRQWMMDHEYESVKQMRGSMSQINSANPSAFERAQYMKALANYKPDRRLL